MSSFTDKVRSDYEEIVGNVEGWAEAARERIPAGLDEVDAEFAKITGSPAYQVLKRLPEGKYLDMGVDFLTKLADLAQAEFGQVPPPATVTPSGGSTAAPSEPDPATVAAAAAAADAPATPQPAVVNVPAASSAPVGG